ncbi:two-component system response regulator NarL [Idiomarina sp. PL1-037]|jgi:two-component system nitrate/nitrite response regulator NarL|uniref:two-component system response regulator NarL n=1 Tax=Idiomarina TaxID=135575 RepID=UPI00294AD5B4|nr:MULTISPECIES: two-component system response regulator NarL [unclassified Idiomarina]MDV6328204.1 two-component system response regulator NarL [Idiomarina sp. Sol25]WQC53169.1 two-component system response regulator NarL [Idiomarina sp. PL1-037]
MTTDAASIMLVDDHPLLRKGLKQLIAMEDDMTVIAEASNGPDALLLAAEHDPDLIVLDLNMQGMDGIETLKRLRDSGVTSRIIMLTVSDADDDVVAAITNGADGYLLKDMEPELLLEQIHRAVTGKMVLSEAITEILATALRQPTQSTTSQLSNLTNREHEILSLIAKGMSNKVIARELDISDGTVKVHVKHLLKKLGLRSRVEAAVWMVNLQGNKTPQ